MTKINMMKPFLILSFFLFGSSFLLAQSPTFELTVNKDSIFMGHTLKVTYTLEQIKSKNKFNTPEFDHFRMISGPMVSSSVSIINGDRSSTETHTFYLTPETPGTWVIPEVTIKTKKGPMTTPAKEIVVLPNPNGIEQESESTESNDFLFFKNEGPQISPKKEQPKRKVYRL